MIETFIKPWGKEIKYAHTANYVGKILHVNEGERLSVQYHNKKDETMYVFSGKGFLHLYTMDEDGDPRLSSSVAFTEGVQYHIPPKQIHSLEAVTDMIVLEVSTNNLNDLVRLKDKYNRV